MHFFEWGYRLKKSKTSLQDSKKGKKKKEKHAKA